MSKLALVFKYFLFPRPRVEDNKGKQTEKNGGERERERGEMEGDKFENAEPEETSKTIPDPR